jgi:hypothetical protein
MPPVWSPHTAANINKIEQVQKFVNNKLHWYWFKLEVVRVDDGTSWQWYELTSYPQGCPKVQSWVHYINKIEQVQKFVNNHFRRQSSITEMLQKLKWDSLQERRARSQLVMGVNLISIISLVNCSRVRDPTTVAGKVFQSLITVGKYTIKPPESTLAVDDLTPSKSTSCLRSYLCATTPLNCQLWIVFALLSINIRFSTWYW